MPRRLTPSRNDVLFDTVSADFGAEAIGNHVIASCEAAWQSVPRHSKNAIARRAISPIIRNFALCILNYAFPCRRYEEVF